jgi:hypothetical protein
MGLNFDFEENVQIDNRRRRQVYTGFVRESKVGISVTGVFANLAAEKSLPRRG